MRRPRHLVLAAAVLFASSSLVLVFATSAYEAPPPAASSQGQVQAVELLGEDADGNGIRDDVDAFIAQRYAKAPELRAAAEQIARSIQPALAVDLSKVDSTAALAEHEVEVMTCVLQSIGPARRAEVEDMINRVSDLTYDNSARFQKREAFRQRANGADFDKPAHCTPAGHTLSVQL